MRRHKGFPKENLGAGGIHFRRASEMKRAPENRKIFGNCASRKMHKIQEDQPGQTIISGHSDQIVDGGDEGAGCNGTMPPLHKWEWQACNDFVYSRKRA